MCRSVQAKGTFPGHACRTPRGARPLPDKRIRPPGTPAAAGSRAHRRSHRRSSHHLRAWPRRREHMEGLGATAPRPRPANPAARMHRPRRRIAVVRPRGVSFAALPVAPLSGNAPGGSAPCRQALRDRGERHSVPKGTWNGICRRGIRPGGPVHGRRDCARGRARRALGRAPALQHMCGRRAQRPASKLPCGAVRCAALARG